MTIHCCAETSELWGREFYGLLNVYTLRVPIRPNVDLHFMERMS